MTALTFFFFGGVRELDVTGAESVAVTVVPPAVPVATTTFVKLAVTFGSAQVYVAVAPGVNTPTIRLQSGVRRSATVTFVSVTSPVFETVIVNVAAPPRATVCAFGPFTMAMAG